MKIFHTTPSGITTVILSLYLFTLCGCINYYKPNSQTVPLFQKAGETQLSAQYSGGPAVSFSAAHSFTDNIGVMANGFIVNNKGYSGSLFEGGAGYFGHIIDSHFILEAYLGYGFGSLSAKSNDSAANPLFDLKATRFFVQPDFGITTKLIGIALDAAVSVRMAALNYSDVQHHPAATGSGYNNLDSLSKHTYLMLEPGITVRAGVEQVRLQVQYVRSAKLGSAPLDYDDQNFSVGLYVKF